VVRGPTGGHNRLEHLVLRSLPVVSSPASSSQAFILSREAMRCTAKSLIHYRSSPVGLPLLGTQDGQRTAGGGFACLVAKD